MLAHQIKSDGGQQRTQPAVDGREPPAPSSPDERNSRQQHTGQPGERTLVETRSGQPPPARPDEERAPQMGRQVSGASEGPPHEVQPAPGARQPARGPETRLLVRRREAGALIGKRGANIKRLRHLFSESTFNIPDTGNGPERVVCVQAGSPEQLAAILAELTQLFQEKQATSGPWAPAQAARPSACKLSELIEVKLLVNASHAGLLIGVGGQSIRKLRNDSKAAIKIYEMCCPLSSERVCAIKAKPPVVVSTIRMIHEILASNPIKGAHKPYDALNFDLSLVDKYGGYAPDDEAHPLPAAVAAQVAVSPLDLLQQLQRRAHHNQPPFPPSPALMLQTQAAQLLAAAAAVSGDRAGAADHLDSSRLPAAPHPGRFSRMLAHCDRYAAAAAMASEKYHSIIKASQQALAAGRFHPYYVMEAHQSNRGSQFFHGGQLVEREQAARQQHTLAAGASMGLSSERARCRSCCSPRELTCSCRSSVGAAARGDSLAGGQTSSASSASEAGPK